MAVILHKTSIGTIWDRYGHPMILCHQKYTFLKLSYTDINHIWQGMFEDLKQRIPFYLSDFYDGFVGEKTLHKTISATIFLYFACILPAIAFGVLNLHNTHGKIGVMDAIMGQVQWLVNIFVPCWIFLSDHGGHLVLHVGGPASDSHHDHGSHRSIHQDHCGGGGGN